MIRDPSDGSVRHLENQPKPLKEESKSAAAPVLGIAISGLPLESTKPDRKERLDKSREWLKQYFKRNPEQGT